MDILQKRRGLQQKRLRLVSRPFLSEKMMQGRPSCTIADFRAPRLRRCPYSPEALTFIDRIDGGLDGFVWKVAVGGALYALKIVSWPPQPGSAHSLTFLAVLGQRAARVSTILCGTARVSQFCNYADDASSGVQVQRSSTR